MTISRPLFQNELPVDASDSGVSFVCDYAAIIYTEELRRALVFHQTVDKASLRIIRRVDQALACARALCQSGSSLDPVGEG